MAISAICEITRFLARGTVIMLWFIWCPTGMTQNCLCCHVLCINCFNFLWLPFHKKVGLMKLCATWKFLIFIFFPWFAEVSWILTDCKQSEGQPSTNKLFWEIVLSILEAFLLVVCRSLIIIDHWSKIFKQRDNRLWMMTIDYWWQIKT